MKQPFSICTGILVLAKLSADANRVITHNKMCKLVGNQSRYIFVRDDTFEQPFRFVQKPSDCPSLQELQGGEEEPYLTVTYYLYDQWVTY